MFDAHKHYIPSLYSFLGCLFTFMPEVIAIVSDSTLRTSNERVKSRWFDLQFPLDFVFRLLDLCQFINIAY